MFLKLTAKYLLLVLGVFWIFTSQGAFAKAKDKLTILENETPCLYTITRDPLSVVIYTRRTLPSGKTSNCLPRNEYTSEVFFNLSEENKCTYSVDLKTFKATPYYIPYYNDPFTKKNTPASPECVPSKTGITEIYQIKSHCSPGQSILAFTDYKGNPHTVEPCKPDRKDFVN